MTYRPHHPAFGRTIAALLLAVASAHSQSTIRPPAAPRNQQVLSPLSLNHLFIVLDPATYSGIVNSEFIRTEFAPMEVRMTERTDQSYRGAYLYGGSTYLEFFHPDQGKELGYRLHDSGIAFGLEEPGAIVEVESRMRGKVPAHLSTITRKYSDEQLPWFYSAEPKDFPFRTWVMEYHPSFLSQWNPSKNAIANEGISRGQILDRYKSEVEEAPKDPCFRDITSITLAVGPDVNAKLVLLYQLWGMRLRNKNGAITLEATDLAIHLIPETDTLKGIQQIEFRLNRAPKDASPRRFGEKSVLTFHGKTGTWTF